MGLYENMRTEPVSRLALREPVTANPDATVREAIERMREQKLGCVIVVDEENKPQGVLTESMLTKLISVNSTIVNDKVSDHMATQWPWVSTTDKIENVLAALHLKNIRFLTVVDEDGRLAGLTGQKGLMEYVAEHFPGQVMVQRVGVAPFPHEREGA